MLRLSNPGMGDLVGEKYLHWVIDEAFCAVVKTHKRRSNKIYKFELTMTKIENQVKCK